MAVIFKQETHSYESLNPEEKIKWISVTHFVSSFKQKFDAVAVSQKVSKNKKSKWYGLDPKTIQKAWDSESTRAITLGTWYHNQREAELLACQTVQRSGVDLPIIQPVYNDKVKVAPTQQLVPGIYPEHFVYLKSAGVCGQADRVEVIGNTIDIYDYKTNKEIKRESFKNWEGASQKMSTPIDHLDDCNFYHYALQLSLYMYMLLKHNHTLKPGKLILHHILFEEDGQDEFGYPVTRYDNDNNPIVREVVPIELPYLRSEVISMINYLHDNREAYEIT